MIDVVAGGATLDRLTETGSDLWRERLAFRDALRADAGLAREYARLEGRLAEQSDGTGDDTAGKRAFAGHVLAVVGVMLSSTSSADLPAVTAAPARCAGPRRR